MTDGAGVPGRPEEAGLTLVELMVVLVFIAIGVLTLCAVQTRSFTNVHETGRYTRALEVAEMQMETARGAGYTLAQSDSGAVDGIDWRCTVQTEDVALRRVTVVASWTDAGTPRSLRLVSLLSSR